MLAFPKLLYAHGKFDPVSDRIDLAAVALEQGSVLVIVELASPFEPEGAVRSKASVKCQRASIAQRQATVLDQIAPYDAELIDAWEAIPFMAVMVDHVANEKDVFQILGMWKAAPIARCTLNKN